MGYFRKGELDPRALVGNYIASGLLIVLPFLKPKNKSLSKIVIEVAKFITDQIRGNYRNFATFLAGEVQIHVGKDAKGISNMIDIASKDRRTRGRFSMIQFSNVGEIKCFDPENCGDFDAVVVDK